jgi:homopolymeric O-antigen transport system permease protein
MLARLRADLRAMLREQVEYRELLLAVTRRDLLLRYRQTVMGFGWAVFTPVLNLLVFSVVFTRVVPIATPVPYPIFAYAGLLPWSFFASALRFSATSLTNNETLVTKVYFPREIFPFAAVLVGLVDFAVAASVLAGLMVYYRVGLSVSLAFLPVVIAVQLIFTAGLALLVAMANLYFRDVRYVFDALLTVWMFATPVLYPVDRVGGHLGMVLALNPMTPIIAAYRTVLFSGALPAADSFAAVALVALATLLVAWVLFHRSEIRFAENI